MGLFDLLRISSTFIVLLSIAVVFMVYFDYPNDGPVTITQFDKKLNLSDGRVLSYAEYGHPTGDVVLYLHGTPSSRFYPWGDSPLLTQRNIRLISFDRPGFGQSTWDPNFSLASVTSDITQLMDHLNITKFSILGISGGAPFTYAALYTIPQRIKNAIIISGMGPVIETGKCPEMMKPFMSIYDNSLYFYKAIIWFMRQFIFYMHYFKLDQSFLEMTEDSLVPSDAAVLQDSNLVQWSNRATIEGLRQGSIPMGVENALFWQDWGFSISNIELQSPLTIWHGSNDINAPPSHSKYACDHIPHANCTFFEDEGHLIFWTRENEIYNELLK